MGISAETFFNLLIEEIRLHPELQGYYRFLQHPSTMVWRKAYFIQRLRYIETHVKGLHKVWDVGSGYGTTGLFLALNGHRVHGSTLEYYFKEVPQRIKYWSQYGDVSTFTTDYEDLFDTRFERSFDAVIVQDTIHHTEPIGDALRIIARSLKPGGRVIVVEENGNNIIQRAKLFRQRGNKRVITIHDERLGKDILMGNENIRSLKQWQSLFTAAELAIEPGSEEYVRVLPPQLFGNDMEKGIQKERRLLNASCFLKEYFFFGLSFWAKKS
jgi:SAM-dependent methyltransferase